MESRLSQETSENLKLPSQVTLSKTIVLKKELHSLIETVKKIQPVTTYGEVLDGLKVYIKQKQLFDPLNPFKICCKDDELGSVVGAKEFTICDVKFILQKLVFPVDKSCKNSEDSGSLHLPSDSSSKRKYEENVECGQKKVCSTIQTVQPPSPMILHIPPSPIKYDSAPDSEYSLQGYETAYVKDTSDDLWSVGSDEYMSCNDRILAIEETFDVEYEVETSSSSLNSSDSDSDDSEICFANMEALDAKIVTVICRTDSDIEFFADDSSEADSEISESDHWLCKKCNSTNDPVMRNCSKCWAERLEWLPDKSEPLKKKKKRRRSKKTLDAERQEASEKMNFPSSSSQETPSSSQIDGSVLTFKQCIICCAKPASASIIHGKYAHQISCYVCARRLQRKKKRCPICRRTIDRVVDNIV